MTLPQSVDIPPEVMARQVGDETVLLDLASGNYFGLDAIGTRMWQLLSEGHAPAQVCQMLLAEYEVSEGQLVADLERLLAELGAQGLVKVS